MDTQEQGNTNNTQVVVVRDDIHEIDFTYYNEASKTKVLCTSCLGREIANSAIKTMELKRTAIKDAQCSHCKALSFSRACEKLGVSAEDMLDLVSTRKIYHSFKDDNYYQVKKVPYSV